MIIAPTYIRDHLGFSKIITDKRLVNLISRFSPLIMSKAGITQNDIDNSIELEDLYKEAVLMAIACDIFSKNPSEYLESTSYNVGNTTQEISDVVLDKLISPCDLYNQALEDLFNMKKPVNQFVTARRRGMSSRSTWRS